MKFMHKTLLTLYTILAVLFQMHAYAEKEYVQALAAYRTLSCDVQKFLYSLATKSQSRDLDMMHAQEIPLYRSYPSLLNTLPHLSLGSFPTPLIIAPLLAQEYGVLALYIKDDGATGGILDTRKLFGGNKVRKLEFLLADAWVHGANSVLTFGCTGSNHAVATAAYAHELGLQPILILKSQPSSDVVQRNLALMHRSHAIFYYAQHVTDITELAIQAYLERKNKSGDFPYIIPTGGSCPRGAIGYVNAMFELKQQIDNGEIAEPDYIYVAAGSLGTLAGIMIGKRATGICSTLIGICTERVASEETYKDSLLMLAHDTSQLLNSLDSTFEIMDFQKNDVVILHQFCGKRYGQFTKQGKKVAQEFLDKAGIKLDGTYTAKAAAGMKADIIVRQLQNKKILFWNTFCSDSFDNEIADFDYKVLPEWAHAAYEQSVQILVKK